MQTPPSPDYVPGPEYPEYVALSDDEIPEDPDPEEDLAGYLADGGDDEEEESSKDGDDDEEEASEEDEDEEEKHLALADSDVLPAIDPVPLAEETEPFKTEESAATPPPPPPQTIVPVSMTHLHRARISVRPYTPPSPSTKALIAEYASTPTHPSPPPSPLSLLSSPLPRIPSSPLILPPLHTRLTYASAPLGCIAAMTDMPSRKRLCLTALASRFEVGENSTATAASIRASKGRVMTAVEEVNERVIDLTTTQGKDAHELYVHCEDAQDDRALLRDQISLLTRERQYFCFMASSYKREAVYARQTWSRSEDRSMTLRLVSGN
ncbi:hypothetical protein Tco_1569688 [Tanacetum coccineum]